MILLILAGIGLLISLYGIFVECNLQKNVHYKAACDISDRVSCTRPFLSPYGKMFGISNILLSAIFYATIMILILAQLFQFLSIALIIGVLVTIIFAYILYFKVRSLCLICTSLYIINILMAVIYFYKI